MPCLQSVPPSGCKRQVSAWGDFTILRAGPQCIAFPAKVPGNAPGNGAHHADLCGLCLDDVERAGEEPRMEAGALQGIRVIELGGPVAAPYAAKLLGDLGADVVVVEPPTGSPARHRGPYLREREGEPEASGLFLYLA